MKTSEPPHVTRHEYSETRVAQVSFLDYILRSRYSSLAAFRNAHGAELSDTSLTGVAVALGDFFGLLALSCFFLC